MKLILIKILTLVILSFTLSAQQILYCPVNSTTDLELEIGIIDHYSNNDSITILNTVKQLKGDEDCSSYYFDLKTYAVKIYTMKPYDYSAQDPVIEYEIDSFICDLDKIKSLKIAVYGVPGKPTKLNLNEIDFTGNLRLPQLEKLKIYTLGNQISFNFSKWNIFKEIIESQTLKELTVEGHIVNKNWFDSFFQLKNLTKINVPEHLSVELKELPNNLRELNFPNLYYLFSHSITELSNLNEMPSVHRGNLRASDYYPEITFIGNALSPNIKEHPYYEINKHLSEKLQNDSTFSGKMELYYSEVYPSQFDSIYSNDYTIALGQVKEGKPIGVWKYKIHRFQAFPPTSWYFYNYSSNNLNKTFSQNGNWTYYYPDSTVAISGKLENNLKEGKWKFYNPDGILVSVKSYEKGKPQGLFNDYYYGFEGSPEQVRRYFFSLSNYISGALRSDGQYTLYTEQYFMYPYYRMPLSLENLYVLNKFGQLYELNDGELVKEIKKSSLKYNRIVKRFIKKLYPEKKLSIDNIYFESR